MNNSLPYIERLEMYLLFSRAFEGEIQVFYNYRRAILLFVDFYP